MKRGRNRFRKGLALLLTLALMGGLLPNLNSLRLVNAAESHKDHPICGTVCNHNDNHEVVTGWKKLTSQNGELLIDGNICKADKGYIQLPEGNYYLADDVSLETSILLQNGDINLCLHGKKLNLGDKQIRLSPYSQEQNMDNFTICDCVGDGIVTSNRANDYENDATIQVFGRFYLYGGKVMNTAQGSDAKNAIASAGHGLINLFGGEVIAKGSYAVFLLYNENTLTLSGSPVIQGGEDSADIYLYSTSHDNSKQSIKIDSPLTNNMPYRLESNVEKVLTSGWKANMGDQDFNQYFKMVSKGFFINKNENCELISQKCSITEQPSSENNYTVTANGTPSRYEWYCNTKAITREITATDAIPYESNQKKSYYKEGMGWYPIVTAYDSSKHGYFTMPLLDRDVITPHIKPSDVSENASFWLERKSQTDSISAYQENDYILTISRNDTYTLFFRGKECPVTFELTRIVGDLIEDQTGRKLLMAEKGTCFCKVIYENGTVLRSDVIEYEPKPCEPHTMMSVVKKAATCTMEGNRAYYICSVCDKCFLDEKGHQEITNKKIVTIDALGHDFSKEWGKNDTDHWRTCTRCGERSEKGNHQFGEWITDKAPTETRHGAKHRNCIICQYREDQEIPKIGTENSPASNQQGTIHIVIEKDENIPPISIATPAKDLANTLLTNTEKQQLESGVDIKIVLHVQDMGDYVSSEKKRSLKRYQMTLA